MKLQHLVAGLGLHPKHLCPLDMVGVLHEYIHPAALFPLFARTISGCVPYRTLEHLYPHHLQTESFDVGQRARIRNDWGISLGP